MVLVAQGGKKTCAIDGNKLLHYYYTTGLLLLKYKIRVSSRNLAVLQRKEYIAAWILGTVQAL